jgi:protein-disulfide isomerase
VRQTGENRYGRAVAFGMKRILLVVLVLAGAARADVAIGTGKPRTLAVGTSPAPARGTDEPLITVVEFANFQCPYCARVHETLEKLHAEFGSRVRVEYRHHPFDFHKWSMIAAEASMAAHAQGKFWLFADTLEAQVRAASGIRWDETAGRARVDAVARTIGLDMKAYEQAMNDHRYRARIDEDLAFAKTLGTNATPTFYINGRKLSGAQPIEKFRAAFEQELARAAKLSTQGFRGAALRDALFSEAGTLPEL